MLEDPALRKAAAQWVPLDLEEAIIAAKGTAGTAYRLSLVTPFGPSTGGRHNATPRHVAENFTEEIQHRRDSRQAMPVTRIKSVHWDALGKKLIREYRHQPTRTQVLVHVKVVRPHYAQPHEGELSNGVGAGGAETRVRLDGLPGQCAQELPIWRARAGWMW